MTMALSMSWRVECCAFYDLPGAKYQLLGGVDVEQHHLITPLGCFFPCALGRGCDHAKTPALLTEV